MSKRILSFLLALVMLVGMIPAGVITASAESNYCVWVGGVCMGDGDYLTDGGFQTTKPSGSYAYYKDGVLTLHDYTVSSVYCYYQSQSSDGPDRSCQYAGIYSEGPLTIQLEGKNSINVSGSGEGSGDDYYYYYYVQAIRCLDMVTVRGEGSLSLSSDDVGILADDDIIIDSGTVNVASVNVPKKRYSVALRSDEDIIINGGNVSIEAEGAGLNSRYGECIINGGAVSICVDDQAVWSNALNIAEGLMVQASTTRDGALGEYVAANFASYKKIVVKPEDQFHAFTTQPVGGDSILDDGLKITWSLDFQPVKQVVYGMRQNSSQAVKMMDLSASATSAVLVPDPNFSWYYVRAYYSDTEFIYSDVIIITIKAPFTANSTFTPGGTMTVDIERIAEYSETWMEDYLDEAITYQWYRNGTAISGATGQSYKPTSADLGKEIYAVIVGSNSLTTPTVTIQEAPAITTQPTTQKVKAGTKATFSVVVEGSNLSYQWQYKTSESGTWKNCTATGNKTATMKVDATTSKSSYYYRCKITGSGDPIYTNVVRLYVLGIKTQPTTQKVKAGTTATFTVSATGLNKTYQWQYKTSADGNWLNCTATGNKTATLKVSATTGKSGYYYRCQIKDNGGNTIYTNVVRLYVLGIKTQPTTQKVKAGTTATFTVSATGLNKTYQWQYKTSADGAWQNCTATGNKTATLKVSATTGKSGYYYRCIIKDSAGNSVTTNTVRLYVLGITTQPTAKTAKAGTTVKFTVGATGAGKTYQWQYKAPNGEWKNSTATGAKTATLSVSVTASKNGYQYRCIIKDNAGNSVISNAAELTVSNA